MAAPDPALLPSDDDLLFEEDVLRSPYSVKAWKRYLDARRDAPLPRRRVLYERALAALPGSYKLWHAYLTELAAAAAASPPGTPPTTSLTATFRRALVTLHTCPVIWALYLDHLATQPGITPHRRAVDAALRALPVTQHAKFVWPRALALAAAPETPAATARALYRRYLKLEPGHAEEYVAYLTSRGEWREAAERLAACVDDDSFVSVAGASRHSLWLSLADVVTKHPDACAGLRVDAMLRAGIRRFSDDVGRLWCALADYHIRRGAYESARAVYEEGLTSVSTVRDFALLYDALTQFEEALIAHRLATAGDDGDDPSSSSDATTFLLHDTGDDVDLRLARLEALTARRPDLLSAVLLRQNPHNVAEWHRRAKLFTGTDPARAIRTYTEAVATVDPAAASGGKPHTLWLAFARLYEKAGDINSARVVLTKAATAGRFAYVDDLAAVWAARIELELRAKRHRAALELAREATRLPPGVVDGRRDRDAEAGAPPSARLYRSAKLWGLRCDLEESLGTLETARAAYDEAIAARVATPAMVLNCAAMLTDASHWEAALAVLDKGVQTFQYPHARELWAAYTKTFVDRYGGSKLERARDLFRRAVDAAPADDKAAFYLQAAALEEAHGPPRAVAAWFDEAMRQVPAGARKPVFDAYVARAAALFGVAKVREVYEAALEAGVDAGGLADRDAVAAALSYAALEARLGEIDRARAILTHAASLADPRAEPGFWDAWHAFEVEHGGEASFREMLRVKRSVAAARSGAHVALAPTAPPPPLPAAVPTDAMAALEAAAAAASGAPAAAGGTAVPGFVAGGTVTAGQPSSAAAPTPAAPTANPDEIDIDDIDDVGGGGDADVAQREVPAAVFGGAGALERLKAAGKGAGE